MEEGGAKTRLKARLLRMTPELRALVVRQIRRKYGGRVGESKPGGTVAATSPGEDRFAVTFGEVGGPFVDISVANDLQA